MLGPHIAMVNILLHYHLVHTFAVYVKRITLKECQNGSYHYSEATLNTSKHNLRNCCYMSLQTETASLQPDITQNDSLLPWPGRGAYDNLAFVQKCFHFLSPPNNKSNSMSKYPFSNWLIYNDVRIQAATLREWQLYNHLAMVTDNDAVILSIFGISTQ